MQPLRRLVSAVRAPWSRPPKRWRIPRTYSCTNSRNTQSTRPCKNQIKLYNNMDRNVKLTCRRCWWICCSCRGRRAFRGRGRTRKRFGWPRRSTPAPRPAWTGWASRRTWCPRRRRAEWCRAPTGSTAGSTGTAPWSRPPQIFTRKISFEIHFFSSSASHLSGPLDALPDAEVAHDPHEQQSAGQLPPDRANVLDALGDLERTTSAKINFAVNTTKLK